MKRNIIKPLIYSLVSASSLIGCNMGHSSQHEPSFTPSRKSNPSIQAASLTSLSLLGNNAWKYDDGREILGLLGSDTLSVFDPEKVEVALQNSCVSGTTDIVASGSSKASSLYAGASVKASYALFYAGVEFSALSASASNSAGITIVSDNSYYANLSLKNLGSGNTFRSKLTSEADQSVTKVLDNGDWETFFATYGNSYVLSAPVTASYQRIITIDARDDKANNELKVKAELGYGSMLAISAFLNTLTEETKKHARVNISTVKKGLIPGMPVETSKWESSPTNSTPAIPQSCLNLSNLDKCVQDASTSDEAYRTNWEINLDKKIIEWKTNHKENPTLDSFVHELGTVLSVANSVPAKCGSPDIYKITIDKYPNPLNGAMINKQGLADLQERINIGIQSAAALGKNSSFLNALKSNNDVYDALSVNPDFKILVDQSEKIQKANDILLSSSSMSEMLLNCFSANSSENICDKYLNNTKITDKNLSKVLYNSLNEYLESVNALKGNAILGLNGFLSSATPIKANVFWMPIQGKTTKYLLPIYLNTKYIDAIKRQGFRHIEYGSFNLENGNLTSAVSKLPVPKDLILEYTDKNGEITGVTRKSNDNNLPSGYLGTFSCQVSDLPNLTSSRRNINLIPTSVCRDSNNNPIIDLSFKLESGPFYEAMQYTMEKPVIEKGVYAPNESDDQHDIGGRILKPGNSWCSSSGRYCLEYDSGSGNLTLTDGYALGNNKIIANARSGAAEITLLPKYDSKKNVFTYYKDNVNQAMVVENSDYTNAALAHFFNYDVCDGISITDSGSVECIVPKDDLSGIKNNAEIQIQKRQSGIEKDMFIHDFMLADKMLNPLNSKVITGKYLESCKKPEVQNGSLTARCDNKMSFLNYDNECWTKSYVSFVNGELKCVIPKDKQNSFTGNAIWTPSQNGVSVSKSNGTIRATWWGANGDNFMTTFNYNEQCNAGDSYKVDTTNKTNANGSVVISCASS